MVIASLFSLLLLQATPLTESSPPPPSISETAAIDPSETPADEKIARRLTDIFSQVGDLESVEVAVRSGVVTLTGSVPGNQSAEEALALAGKIEGVVYVRDRLEEATEVSARVSPAIKKLREIGNRTLALLPVIAVAIAIVLVFWFIGSFLARSRGLFRRLGLSDLASELVRRIIRTVVLGIGIVIALEILDATAVVGAVLGIAGVAGVALGFAFRNIVENYLAGVLLSTRNPFSIGDHVEIGGFAGKVARLTSRDTVLMTLDGNHLRIPNSAVINRELVNYTRNPLRRFEFAVGVSVDLDLSDARRVGIDSLSSLSGILSDPPPTALVEELGDSAVVLRFFGWIDQTHSDFRKARSEAIRTVKSAFDAADIEMPEPIYRVHLRDQVGKLEPATASAPTKAEDPKKKLPPAPLETDVTADDTIDKQLAADLAKSEEPNLLKE